MMTAVRWAVLVAAAVLLILGSLYTLGQAHADNSTPTPVIGTGGNISGSQQGISCITAPAQRFTPTAGSNPYAWAEPDWPGFFAVATPAPSASNCSR